VPSTYEKIATYTAPSNVSNVTFTSIPNTYTDLVLIGRTSLVGGGAGTNYLATYNGDTGTNYSYTFLEGTGSAAGSGRASNSANMDVMYQPNGSGIGTLIMQVFNYSNTTTYKTMLSKAATAGSGFLAYAGLWRNTAAITSINLAGGTNNIASGSSFTLYGIKAA
jgi:hypothetical protein